MEKFDLKKLTENKPLLYTIVVAIVIVVVMFVIMMSVMVSVGSKGAQGQDNQIKQAEKVIKNDPVTLFTTENTGKALEVQALLAREQIVATKVENGSKVSIVLNGAPNKISFGVHQ